MKKITLVPLFLLSYLIHSGQQLKRQALIDYTTDFSRENKNPVSIKDIPENSAFYKSGLRKKDRIITIDNTVISSGLLYQKMTRKWRENRKIDFVIGRGSETVNISCNPQGKPLEKIAGCTTVYDEAVTKDNFAVRMIVTKPEKAGVKKLPVIFFVGWLSCDQVEINRSSMDGWAFLLEDLASKSGYVLVRTEKPGLGDSNGPDCSECNLAQEINSYKASFDKMLTYDFIDKENIILMGGSIGGALAPVIAEGRTIKGLISTGGFSTTWYEHILDFERNRLFFSGTGAEKIDSLNKQFSSFYYEYLIRKKKPSEIIKNSPSYASLWYQTNDLQFGRPVMYYQQLQDLNMSYYWNKVSCPVLVLYGEYDWIMSRAEQENIIQVLDKKKPGLAELKIIPGMNHHYSKYATAQEAFDEPFIKYDETAFIEIKKWLDGLKPVK